MRMSTRRSQAHGSAEPTPAKRAWLRAFKAATQRPSMFAERRISEGKQADEMTAVSPLSLSPGDSFSVRSSERLSEAGSGSGGSTTRKRSFLGRRSFSSKLVNIAEARALVFNAADRRGSALVGENVTRDPVVAFDADAPDEPGRPPLA